MSRHLTHLLLAASFLLPATTAVANDIGQDFARPAAEFSPVPIWWWSGDPVERERIRTQLQRLAEGGIYNAIILNLAPSGPLYGSAADEPPFLTEAWWDLFGYALGEAKNLGIRLWFYDQLGFSGAGLQARVVRDHPEFRGVELRREVKDVAAGEEVALPVPASGTPVAAFLAELEPGTRAKEVPAWIWDPLAADVKTTRYFRRTFYLDAVPAEARIAISCDNGYALFVNGQKIGEECIFGEQGWGRAERFDVASALKPGKNIIAVQAENLAGIGGLLLEFSWKDAAGENRLLVTDKQFRVNDAAPEGWMQAEFDDAAWREPKEICAFPGEPWGPIRGMVSSAAITLGDCIHNVQDITSSITDGVLRVTPPAGPHRVQLFYTVPGGFDYQNPAAGAALIDVVHGEMERRFGDELGKTIAGSFQDEFPAIPRYSIRMPAEFQKRKGYDLIAKLPALYDDVTDSFGDAAGPSTVRVRCDVSDVAAALNEEAFFIPLHEWHARHGMLCGYDQTVRNADPLRGENYYVDYFKTMRHYSVPGNDMDGDAKPHASIADLYGRPRVWIEAFHSSGWGQTLEEIAVLLHPWFVNGATLFNPHAIYYSIHGSYYEWAPPDTGWRQPYFAQYRVLADYVARLSKVLSSGHHVVDVGVLHPAKTVHAYTGFGGNGVAAQIASDAYWSVQASLQRERVDYIAVDEDSLERMTLVDGVLCLNGLCLRVLVLPATRVLGAESLKKIAAFAKDGGRVIIAAAAPEQPADSGLTQAVFGELAGQLAAAAVRTDDPDQVAALALETAPRAIAESLPVLHRKAADRDFYFLLSDTGTAANGAARFEINKRALYETDAAMNKRIEVTFRQDGIPEFWDALSGKIAPILQYTRDGGTTRARVDLSVTPAPLIALRPALSSDPAAVESDLEVLSVERSAVGVAVAAAAYPDSAAGDHAVTVRYADQAFTGTATINAPVSVPVPGPLACRYAQTCDNTDGSFAWPPSEGVIPVETRAFHYREETPGTDASAWADPKLDDADWPVVKASYGVRAVWAGPLAVEGEDKLAALAAPPADPGELQTAVYSLKLGIDEDDVFTAALGGKGRIPEEFIDLGEARGGEVYLVRAVIMLPPEEAVTPLSCVLRVGSVARKRAFLNGAEITFQGAAGARTLCGPATLQPGENKLDLLLSRVDGGRLRCFYQFLPADAQVASPEWIWGAERSPTERVRFVKRFDVAGTVTSAAMVAALGDLHQIRVNGTLVADQGNFDPYFTSRAERYDITAAIKEGPNEIEVVARDAGAPVGLLVDGRVDVAAGSPAVFVSDDSWLASPVGQENAAEAPARVLSGPAQGYMGDPACLQLWARPHPLPLGGWLLDQPAPNAPFGDLVYAATAEAPAPGWYRFRIPPGATEIRWATPGRAKLYVNGVEVSAQATGGRYAAALPEPDSAERIAALRIASVPGYVAGGALLEPVTYAVGEGRIALGSWDALGLPHYSGGLVYSAQVELAGDVSGRVILDLGRVRGTAEVAVNGVVCGARIWHPYRFDITEAAKPGVNTVEIRVLNTLGPHFDAGHPSHHVYEGQTKSGIFGPINVTVEPVVNLTLAPG